jgi:hypothetical protein
LQESRLPNAWLAREEQQWRLCIASEMPLDTGFLGAAPDERRQALRTRTHEGLWLSSGAASCSQQSAALGRIQCQRV